MVDKMTMVLCLLTSLLYTVFHSPDRTLDRYSVPIPEPLFLTSLRKL